MMTKHTNAPASRDYWRFQLLFWGGYWVLNVIFARAWGYSSVLTDVLFVGLSALLLGLTHGYRGLYVRYGLDRSIGFICVHLLWLLPLSGMLVQAFVGVIVYAMLRVVPVASQSVGPWSPGAFVGYTFNTMFILMLWCLICLLRSEWVRRRDAERDYWQNQLRLREVELQFLRSQISSHFLFNALNNIRALILEDPNAARQGLSDLATLLRGLMHSEAVATVSLRDELELVKNYLALEALQFETRLSFELSIDPRVQDAKVPPLLLQTLVENAIKHGIARRLKGGALRISATLVGESRWRLQVENPPAELPATHAGNGIGLKNARERLKAVFGELASLELTFAGKVLATAELPR